MRFPPPDGLRMYDYHYQNDHFYMYNNCTIIIIGNKLYWHLRTVWLKKLSVSRRWMHIALRMVMDILNLKSLLKKKKVFILVQYNLLIFIFIYNGIYIIAISTDRQIMTIIEYTIINKLLIRYIHAYIISIKFHRISSSSD